MNTDCRSCFELIKKGTEHPDIRIISDVGNSQVCKCGNCGALLMSNSGVWEQVIKGTANRQQKTSKSNAA